TSFPACVSNTATGYQRFISALSRGCRKIVAVGGGVHRDPPGHTSPLQGGGRAAAASCGTGGGSTLANRNQLGKGVISPTLLGEGQRSQSERRRRGPSTA